jgi:hypothetical protein
MTHRVNDTVLIYPEAPRECARCREKKETRDIHGDGTLRLCFKCATDAEKAAYAQRIFGTCH